MALTPFSLLPVIVANKDYSSCDVFLTAELSRQYVPPFSRNLQLMADLSRRADNPEQRATPEGDFGVPRESHKNR